MNNGGFSLVEVLCSILILGIGLVGMTQGITTALHSNKESELQTTAALLAADRIETLRADGFLTEGEDTEDFVGGFSLYRWQQAITGTDIDGLYEVEIVIENTRSDQAIYPLRTLLFDPPFSSITSSTNDSSNLQSAKTRSGGSR